MSEFADSAGVLISFEGIDFCGKSLQAEETLRQIRKTFPQRRVSLFREPGGTVISEKIRTILLDPGHQEMNAITELLLYEAARSQLIAEKLLPLLNDGEIVLLDRFYDSTTAYQGFGRGIDRETIFQAHRIATHGLVPNLTLFIDISPETAFFRRRHASRSRDRMEKEKIEFYQRVREGFLWLMKQEPERFRRIDGEQEIEKVFADIWQIVNRFLTEKYKKKPDSVR